MELINNFEENFFFDLFNLRQNVPRSVSEALWSPIQKDIFTPQQSFELSRQANYFLKNHFCVTTQSSFKILNSHENLLLNYNSKKSHLLEPSDKFDQLNQKISFLNNSLRVNPPRHTDFSVLPTCSQINNRVHFLNDDDDI